MAEAVGLAASVGGLVGLMGQLLEGCIFIKDSVRDAKNAPQEIKLLSEEVDILSSAARNTKRLMEQMKVSGLAIDEAEYEPALRQCIRAVEVLGKQLRGYAEKSSRSGGLK
jgi:hypothetical protein